MDKKIEVYNVYSDYLKDRYGEKVYKLPINLPLTCPNRDGTLGRGGCIFCGEEGGSFENLSNENSIASQVKKNKDYIGSRYKAKKFIAYFQNFTNTYLPISQFKDMILESIIDEDIIGVAISTRPDCIGESHYKIIDEVKREYNIEVIVELGLQTVNYKSLKKINRGHSLAEYVEAVNGLNSHKIRNCTHLILNLPWDDMEDVIENAKMVSALRVDEIKLHGLYIVDGTLLGNMYKKGEITMITRDEYVERVITFLEYLSPDIVIQRLIGRAPEENSLFVNWNESWWKIRDDIISIMEERQTYQGKKYNYLGGKGIKKFL